MLDLAKVQCSEFAACVSQKPPEPHTKVTAGHKVIGDRATADYADIADRGQQKRS
jgi:hypothetical protein